MILFILLGCDPESATGPFALAYDGGEDCVEVDFAGVEVPATFTVEAWVRGDPATGGAARPFLEWKGLFTLGEALGGDTSFVVGDTTGAASVASVMDGVLHHVAGTWDGDKASLWVDGARQAFADGGTTSPTSTLRIGCNASADAYEGLLDEVRLSGADRYGDEDFDPPALPYEDDEDTLALFHFDEGTGTEAYDEPRNLVAGVYGPDWIAFQLGSE